MKPFKAIKIHASASDPWACESPSAGTHSQPSSLGRVWKPRVQTGVSERGQLYTKAAEQMLKPFSMEMSHSRDDVKTSLLRLTKSGLRDIKSQHVFIIWLLFEQKWRRVNIFRCVSSHRRTTSLSLMAEKTTCRDGAEGTSKHGTSVKPTTNFIRMHMHYNWTWPENLVPGLYYARTRPKHFVSKSNYGEAKTLGTY